MEAIKFSNKWMAYSLADLIYNFPEGAHFKEAKTFTYQISNQANLNTYQLNDEKDLIGKTVHDLKREIMIDEWTDAFVQEVHESDVFVVENKKPITLTIKKFLGKNGFLVFSAMTKMPIFDENKQVIGILTLSYDATKYENIFNIKKLYSKLYDAKKANIMFMKHINFEIGIDKKFSSKEMDCLLALIKFRSHKKASHHLSIQPKTLDNHISNIREKSSNLYNIQGILEMLSSKINWI